MAVSIVWDLSYIPVEWASDSVLNILLHRDRTLRQSWVTSFNVVVQSQEIVDQFKKMIEQRGDQNPSCLEWKVKPKA
jgi:hypothetical protein